MFYQSIRILSIGNGALTILSLVSGNVSAQRDDGPPAHNFGGMWSLRQSNGFVVNMKLTQNSRGEITGTATANARNGVSTGTVTGRAWRTNGPSWQNNVDHFQVEIGWNGPVGVYHASASWSEGLLRGQTHQKTNHRRGLIGPPGHLHGVVETSDPAVTKLLSTAFNSTV
jgi:hypothetical protein